MTRTALHNGALEQGYLAGAVRRGDRPRYYATLFAPPGKRAGLYALYAFALEIARIPDAVTNAGLGEIRLQWWRDALAAIGGGEAAGGSPVVDALAASVRLHRLPVEPLIRLVDARGRDL